MVPRTVPVIRRCAAPLLALFLTPQLAGAQAVPPVPSYTDIVELYRSGAFADAVAALQRISPDDAKADADALLRATVRAGGVERVKAAGMLHTESGIMARGAKFSRSASDWAVAARFMVVVEDQDPYSALVRTWRLLMTSFLQGQQDLLLAMDYARGTWRPRITTSSGVAVIIPAVSGSSTLPGGLVGDEDAELHLTVGAIHEIAWTQLHEAGAGIARGDLDVAARDLRRALAMQPDLIEARIRLARVLTLDGKTDEAARVFAEMNDGALEPGFRYLSQLFRGDLAERQGATTAAEQSYAAAIETMPVAQSAQLALAHLHHAAGERADAGVRVHDMAIARDATGSADPWLWYFRGMAWRSQGYLADLRQMIHPGTER